MPTFPPTNPHDCLSVSRRRRKKPEQHACEICLCRLPALRRIYEPDPDPHLSAALGEHSRPQFISVRGAVSETTSRRWSKLVPASDVAINQGAASDVVCHIWSSVIYPHHHRAESVCGYISQTPFIRGAVWADSPVHLKMGDGL